MTLNRICSECGKAALVADDKETPNGWVFLTQSDGTRVDFDTFACAAKWSGQFG